MGHVWFLPRPAGPSPVPPGFYRESPWASTPGQGRTTAWKAANTAGHAADAGSIRPKCSISTSSCSVTSLPAARAAATNRRDISMGTWTSRTPCSTTTAGRRWQQRHGVGRGVPLRHVRRAAAQQRAHGASVEIEFVRRAQVRYRRESHHPARRKGRVGGRPQGEVTAGRVAGEDDAVDVDHARPARGGKARHRADGGPHVVEGAGPAAFGPGAAVLRDRHGVPALGQVGGERTGVGPIPLVPPEAAVQEQDQRCRSDSPSVGGCRRPGRGEIRTRP